MQRFGDLDVRIFVAIAADLVHGVEFAEHLGLLREAVPDNVDDFALFVIAFEDVAFASERVRVCDLDGGMTFVVVFFQVAFGFFEVSALGIFALFVGHVPADFVGEERFEGHLHARVEIQNSLAEYHEGIASQVRFAILGAVTVEAEVGADQKRIFSDESHEVTPVDIPKRANSLVMGVIARGVLGDGDEGVDLGFGSLGGVVLHEHLLWEGENLVKRRQNAL